jgi:hypothetical protein
VDPDSSEKVIWDPDNLQMLLWIQIIIVCIFFGGLERVGHSFAYVAHFVFLRDVWIRTQRADLASRRTTNLATHLLQDPNHWFTWRMMEF